MFAVFVGLECLLVLVAAPPDDLPDAPEGRDEGFAHAEAHEGEAPAQGLETAGKEVGRIARIALVELAEVAATNDFVQDGLARFRIGWAE